MDAAFGAAKNTFGVSAVQMALEAPKDMDAILAAIESDFMPYIEGAKTFKVEAKRADKKFPRESPEICKLAGGAIREACRVRGGWRLPGSTLYVTLEPCPMCMGAAVNARIERVVFGASDPKGGACGGLFNLLDYPLNHHPETVGGVCREECSQILTAYFKNKRAK